MTHPAVHLQMTSEEKPSVPHWFGEVAIVARIFTTSGVLKNIEEQGRFARARFGTKCPHRFYGLPASLARYVQCGFVTVA